MPFALQLPCAIILGAMIQLFPYSPRWLAMQDRHEDCLDSLSKLRNLPASDERVQAEYQGILAEVKFQAVMLERRHPGVRGLKLEIVQWLDLFTIKRWRRTAVGVGVCFFQQLQGVNVSRIDTILNTESTRKLTQSCKHRHSSTTLRHFSETLANLTTCR